METKTRLDLKLVLPELPDAKDACVGRLTAMLEGSRGIEKVHIVEQGGQASLCLHYDPKLVSPAEVERRARAAGGDITQRYGHANVPIRAVTGEDAGRRIEASLRAVPGVMAASVSLPAQRLGYEWDRTATSQEKVQAEIDRLGYGASKAPAKAKADHEHTDGDHEHSEGDGHDHGEEDASWFGRNKELVWSLSGGALLLAAWLGERYAGLPRPAAVALYVASYAFGAWDLASHWARSAVKGKFTFDIDLLMLLAAVGAAILGEWTEGAFLLFLFSLAHALEHYAMGRARNAIKALADLTPDTALVQRDGKETEVPIAEVKVGDVVVVHPGQRIPVDGKVKSGRSAVNQAPITGESVPVEKAPGEPVFAGSVNGDGALEIENENAVGDRTLDRVVKLVEEAQTQKAPTEQFVDRFSSVFVPCVLVADVLLIVVPPLLNLLPWSASFYRGMALLVAASPCALALGTPSAVLAGIAQAARRGVLIKGGAHLENLGAVKAMAFDKTGTLTVGKPEVTDVVPASGVEANELLAVAAAVEARSQHPLAEAVVRKADSDKVAHGGQVGELQSLTGRGVRSSVDGKTVEIGNLRLWREDKVTVPDEIAKTVERLSAEGKSILVVRQADRWLGTIAVADQPRGSVRESLDALRKLGIERIVMLTGDNKGVGEAIGKLVGVDEVKAELMPEDKVTTVRELVQRYGKVAMTGDGVNDAPALANATVGIAMGGAGTAVALETADVALMGDDLGKMPFAVGLARQASAVVKQNLYISLTVVAVLVVATVTGLLRIGPAVFFHEGSTLVVIANSLRLLAYGGKEEPKKA